MQHVHLRIQGRVQGVGYRWFAQREAEVRGISGSARNCSDGSVEVHAEGPRAALEEFIALLRRGPVAARVTDLSASWTEAPSRHRGFRIGL